MISATSKILILLLTAKFFIESGTYMIIGLLAHELLDHGLNDGVELALNVCIVDVSAHLILIP